MPALAIYAGSRGTDSPSRHPAFERLGCRGTAQRRTPLEQSACKRCFADPLNWESVSSPVQEAPGEKPNRAMHQIFWYSLIGLASLEKLEASIT
jgi:hypothetical protein